MYVRVRPLNEAERERGAAWRVEANGMAQVDPATEARLSDTAYKLDAIFDGGQPTADVYEQTTQGLIRQVVNGFNSTVFAYGQTSSGKTHTMKGTPGEPGIIPMAVREVFQLIAACQDREFLLRVSYMEVGAVRWAGRWLLWRMGPVVAGCECGIEAAMQSVAVLGADRPAARWQPATAAATLRCPHAHLLLSRSPQSLHLSHLYCMYCLPHLYRLYCLQLYNEDINDLLAPDNQKLAVHETKEAGVYVAGLREDIVASPEQVGG